MTVRGHVNQPLSLSLADLLGMPRVEVAAICQCSGNSRGFFQPRVSGAQWENGAMGNARWTRRPACADVLDRAGVKAGAVAVRSSGLDEPVVEGAPKFMKPLDIDHARDGEVIVAFQMNGEHLAAAQRLPVRLVVPGWYSRLLGQDVRAPSRCSMRRTRATLKRLVIAFPTRRTRVSSRGKRGSEPCRSAGWCRAPFSPTSPTRRP